jgi:alkaline phosphatase D
MPVKTGANTYFTYDFWHGYPGERREILEHIKAKAIKDVVFLTGDIHTFAAGDVQLTEGGESVATEIIGGSMTSLALGEGDIALGGGTVLKGNDANPNTSPDIINALVGLNPWVDYADFDHHGYVVVEATRTELTAKLRRIDTIKKRSAKRLPDVSTRSPAATPRSRASAAAARVTRP